MAGREAVAVGGGRRAHLSGPWPLIPRYSVRSRQIGGPWPLICLAAGAIGPIHHT